MRQALNPSVSIPWWSFLSFQHFTANTSSWADCILGNGKPQSCNHPSVLTLHIGQQLTHIHTLKFAAAHSAHNLSVRLFWVCSRSMTEGFMGSFTTFLSSCSHISWQASVSLFHGVVLNSGLFDRQCVGQLWMSPPALYISEAVSAKRKEIDHLIWRLIPRLSRGHFYYLIVAFSLFIFLF